MCKALQPRDVKNERPAQRWCRRRSWASMGTEWEHESVGKLGRGRRTSHRPTRFVACHLIEVACPLSGQVRVEVRAGIDGGRPRSRPQTLPPDRAPVDDARRLVRSDARKGDCLQLLDRASGLSRQPAAFAACIARRRSRLIGQPSGHESMERSGRDRIDPLTKDAQP